MRYSETELAVEVRDDGDGHVAPADGLGHGLVGIRERVKIYGGDMSAGADRQRRVPPRGEASPGRLRS